MKDDDEAISLMNDSRYGLTASIWTKDAEAALRIGERVDTGTWFMNRCDYLDPALAWTGVKDSGRGCTLSRLGLERLPDPSRFICVWRDRFEPLACSARERLASASAEGVTVPANSQAKGPRAA